jgi:hypothetical protein
MSCRMRARGCSAPECGPAGVTLHEGGIRGVGHPEGCLRRRLEGKDLGRLGFELPAVLATAATAGVALRGLRGR